MPVAKLDNAPRCQHTKLNGSPCAAPARRGRKYCVFHEAAHAKRPDYAVRLVEDAMSLQLALYQVMRALDDHSIDPKRAALKLYALQIAASNLKRLHEETKGIGGATDYAHQKSVMEMFLDALQISDEEREELFSEAEAEMHNSSAPKVTIQACAEPSARCVSDGAGPSVPSCTLCECRKNVPKNTSAVRKRRRERSRRVARCELRMVVDSQQRRARLAWVKAVSHTAHRYCSGS